MTRPKLWAAILVVSAAIAAATFVTCRDRDVARTVPSLAGPERDTAATRGPAIARRGPEVEILRDPSGRPLARRVEDPSGPRPRAAADPAATARAIAEYRERTKYPPGSGRLRADDRDLMTPNQRPERPTPSRADSDVLVLYAGNLLSVTGDERFESTLVATRDGEVVPVVVHGATARVLFRDGHPERPLTYVARDGTWTHSLAPRELGLTGAATIELEIAFDVGGGTVERRQLRFAYTPQNAIPGRFTGRFRDAIEDGSLALHAGVEIAVPGFYLIDCNLYGPDGQPVAWTRFKGELPAGASEVRLLFHGKLLRDVGIEPPFHIGQLRGVLRVERREPGYDQMPMGDWRYTTRSRFRLADLTDVEYEDEHERHMIELMETHGVKPEPP